MASTTAEKACKHEEARSRRRRPNPIEPDMSTVIMTIAMTSVAVMLAIQATDAVGRSLAWASIVGYIIMGATGKFVARSKVAGNRLPDGAWNALLVVSGICELLAMMIVWGGVRL